MKRKSKYFQRTMTNRITQIEQYLQEQPEDEFLLHALAMEYKKMNRLDDAERLLKRVIDKNPKYIGSYYQLAQILQDKGCEPDALNTYEQGMKMAKQLGEWRTYNELRTAWEALMDD